MAKISVGPLAKISLPAFHSYSRHELNNKVLRQLKTILNWKLEGRIEEGEQETVFAGSICVCVCVSTCVKVNIRFALPLI